MGARLATTDIQEFQNAVAEAPGLLQRPGTVNYDAFVAALLDAGDLKRGSSVVTGAFQTLDLEQAGKITVRDLVITSNSRLSTEAAEDMVHQVCQRTGNKHDLTIDFDAFVDAMTNS